MNGNWFLQGGELTSVQFFWDFSSLLEMKDLVLDYRGQFLKESDEY